MEGQKLTILKKKGKGGAAGHHGGSWKVAFADFMTAMMAFFLLMWLLSMGPQKKKEELAHYFKTVSLNLFGTGGSSPSTIPLTDTPGGPPNANPETAASTESESGEPKDTEMEEMKAQLEAQIQQRLSDVKDQVVIGKFDGGLKIDIMDKAGRPMFQLGSTELTEEARKVLVVISDTIKESTQKLEIEGHTDSLGYSNNQKFGNWELSTARASAARIELEKDGLNSTLLMRVSGYADTEPIIKDNPADPRNRRISLRLLYPEAKKESPAPTEIAPDLKKELPSAEVAPHQPK